VWYVCMCRWVGGCEWVWVGECVRVRELFLLDQCAVIRWLIPDSEQL
jgi:hypothetical protein